MKILELVSDVDEKPDDPHRSKIERLRIASEFAPIIREASHMRKIKRVSPSGEVVGYTTHAEIIERHFLREGIEITRDPKPGERPQALYCACGLPFMVPKKGSIPKRCTKCNYEAHRCTKVVNGERCKKLSRKKASREFTRRCELHPFTTADRSACGRAGARAANTKLTPEERSARARAANAKFTPEERSARGRAGARASGEARRKNAKKQ